jgi:hypothetical protein
MRFSTGLFIAALALAAATPLRAQVPQSKPMAWSKAPVTANDLRIVERAAKLLSSPESWSRVDTSDCVPGATKLSLRCTLAKAAEEITGRVDDQSAAMQEARATVTLVAARDYGSRLSDYNDDPATTFADLQEFLRIVRNRLIRRTSEADSAGASIPGEVSEARPPVTETDLRIVRRAREILNTPAKWNRADTRVCPPGAGTFSLYCALEQATREVTGTFGHRDAAMQESRFVIDDIAPNAPYYTHRLMHFNNDTATTFFDVQKFFQLLDERIAARLAEEGGRKAGK